MSRETLEECGLTITELDKVGVIVFEFVDDPQLLEVHVYRTEQYSGEVTETEGAYIMLILRHGRILRILRYITYAYHMTSFFCENDIFANMRVNDNYILEKNLIKWPRPLLSRKAAPNHMK